MWEGNKQPEEKETALFKELREVWKDEASSCLRSCVSEKVQFNPTWHH